MSEDDLKKAISRKENYIRLVKGRGNRVGSLNYSKEEDAKPYCKVAKRRFINLERGLFLAKPAKEFEVLC